MEYHRILQGLGYAYIQEFRSLAILIMKSRVIKEFQWLTLFMTLVLQEKSDQTRKDYNFENEGEFLIESIFLPLFQFSIAISASGIGQHRMLIERLNNYSMAGIVVRDGNNGRVALTATGRASVTYELTKRELKIIAKGTEILGKMWFRLGARKIVIPHRRLSIIEKEQDIPKLVGGDIK